MESAIAFMRKLATRPLLFKGRDRVRMGCLGSVSAGPGTVRRRGRGVVGRWAVAFTLLLALSVPARGEEGWQAEFEQTCSRTTEAMDLTPAELKALLERCAALQKVIESRDESVRKVYLKRLALCRNLYAYVLEHKQAQVAQ